MKKISRVRKILRYQIYDKSETVPEDNINRDFH